MGASGVFLLPNDRKPGFLTAEVAGSTAGSGAGATTAGTISGASASTGAVSAAAADLLNSPMLRLLTFVALFAEWKEHGSSEEVSATR